LYQDETVGRFETSIDAAFLNGWVTGKGVGYIEQIGVKPGYSRLGIGSQLIAKSKLLKPQGLIADVFIHPVKNEASLQFFSYQGFEKAGILYQHPTAHANFPIAHQTQVIFWNLAPPKML
jgi:ribosomal protein S18 acetylase RimI-like enzyme